MSRKKPLLPPTDRLDRNQLLQEAEALDQACRDRDREERRQWRQLSWRTRWERAVADLTCDPSHDLGREAPIPETCAAWAESWSRFSLLLRQAELAARALQLQPDTDDARTAAVELFHHAARGTSAAEFEKLLVFLASRSDLRNFKAHVSGLAAAILSGNGTTQTTEQTTKPLPTASGSEPPAAPHEPPKEWLAIDVPTASVRVQNTLHPIAHVRTFRLFQALYEAHQAGQTPISGERLARGGGLCGTDLRPERYFKKHLPVPLQQIIDSQPGRGGGYSIKQPKPG